MSDLQKRIAELSPQKRALLLKKLEEKKAGAVPGRIVPRPEGTAPLPVSFAQQRLWFLDQLEPGTPLYNLHVATPMLGVLDIPVMERALEEVVRRHEALRTVFAVENGVPVQVVLPPGPVPLPVEDLTGLPEEEREREIFRRNAEEAVRPFDLAKGPLLRARLLRFSHAEQLLAVTMHHIVSDGWSMQRFVSEVADLYEAFVKGRPSPLPEFRVQYADFALWQRRHLSGPVLEAQVAYWKNQLAGAPPVLDLPTDRPRPTVRSRRGKARRIRVPKELSASLGLLSQAEGVSLFMTLLAAWKALLFQWSRQPDVSVGTPIANRTRVEVEHLIGFFVNTLVLRTDLSGDPTFRELLGRVRETSLGAFAHQDLPFEKIVEELQPERGLSHTPLFQVMFILQNAAEKAAVRENPFDVELTVSKFDLTLDLAESEDGIAGNLEYDTDLFDDATIERLAARFERVLAAVVERPELRLSSLPLLSEEEHETLLHVWGETPALPVPDVPLHRLFEEQVDRTPRALALVAGDERLTYAELELRANRLAHRLLAAGVGPESLVALCAGRGANLLVGVLGILKAGAAYVPLDPEYPAARLAFTLADAGARALLTEERLLPRLPAGETEETRDTQILLLDRDVAEERFSSARPASDAGAGGLAYVIYTSGSTGRPKGVAIGHRSAVALVEWARRAFSREELAGVLASTSLCFDLSVFELFVPLAVGGTVHLVADALALAERPEGVTLVNTVPSALAELLNLGPLPDSVLAVNVAGEPLRGALVARTFERSRARRVLNLYGPSEDTTYSTVEVLARPEAAPDAPWEPGIGRPLPGTRAYVLDAALRPVAPGAPGELYLAGDGLARGYLGRPDVTAERFLPDPFGAAAGARMYRTGDLVRFRQDATLDFLGRIDSQVKVRGYRIELGEIEIVLGEHPDVEEAVVVVRDDPGAGKRIAAYVASRTPLDAGELRRWAGERLPAHMVPSFVTLLPALPRTPNGKVDRSALPAPEAAAPAAPERPLTPVEEELLPIFAAVLGLPAVGLRDGFFERGGHSLLATQLVSRLRESFRVELPLRDVFESPTPAELAARVERLRAETPAQLPELRAGSRPERIPLSFAQQRLWFLSRLEPESTAYNMPTALRHRGPLDVHALQRALSEIVARHEVLRTTFALAGETPVQVIAPPSEVPLPVVGLEDLPEEAREAEARRLAEVEARRPFDLSTGPLLRARLVRLGPEDHVLLLTIHHVATDGWSAGIFAAELSALHEAFAAGRPAALPPLPVQYADFAIWQRGLEGDLLAGQLDYWKTKLAGALPRLALPADRPRPAVPSTRGAVGAVARLRLDAEELASLRALSRREGATLFMTLLAAFQALLSRLSGETDLLVGTPIAGRSRGEVEGLIGFFVNTLVLRTDLGGRPSFRTLLARTKETALGAFAHQDIPFERLVEELQPARSLSHTPLFQVFFNMLSFHGGSESVSPEETPALAFEPFGETEPDAKFDLTLYAAESEEGLSLDFVYNAELFSAERMAETAAQLERLLLEMVRDPEQPFDAPSLVTPRARALFPDPAAPLAAVWDGPVTERLWLEARRNPGRIAVDDSRETWTYDALDAWSNRLANALRAHGAGHGARVAVYAHRSASLVWALTSVMKAGAAFVILDPAYPAARLVDILRQAQAEALITLDAAGPLPAPLASYAASRPWRCRFALPSLRAAAAGHFLCEHDDDAPAVRIGPADLAYLAFTSGTTGVPKGILGTHAPLSHFFRWEAETFGLGPDDRFSLLSGLAHDPLLRDVFTPLTLGATLVIPDPEELETPGGLLAWMTRERITVAHLTPAMGRLLGETGGKAARADALRWAFFGGDVLTRRDVASLARVAPRAEAVNFYGTTETPQAMAFHRAAAGEAGERIPVGRGVDGAQLLVVNGAQEMAGAGEVGEILVRSPYLSLGYLDDAAGTDARFGPSPWSVDAADRVYRTGDLGRYRLDGSVELIGRRDGQVKVRGFRVETREVESALGELPDVREAAVVLREDRPGDSRLVAYVVPESGVEASDAQTTLWRSYLHERLPDYMVPAALVTLGAIPRTPNGKRDLRALPAPAAAGARFTPPRPGTEERLAAIWAEVLGVPRVGAADGFFELGGHSLLAIRVLARVEEAFGVALPLRALFDAPTVAGLAARVEGAGAAPSLPPLRRAPRDGELPLSFAQQRLWFLDRLAPGSPAYNIPLALGVRGPLEAAPLAAALSEIVRRHEALRTSFVEREGTPAQVIHPASPVPLPVVDLEPLPAGERAAAARRIAEEEAGAPFDLARDPLLRARLLRLGAGEHVLLLTTHHIAGDAWSSGLLLRELSALYEAGLAGRPSPLAEPEVQYADFALWQREVLAGDALERQLAFWREELAGAPALLELPTDRPRPPVPSARGAVQGSLLPHELRDAVARAAEREGATLFMALFAAFQALLARWSGEEDLLVGTPIAGRGRRETEELIGFFANTLVLRGDLSGDPSFVELLARTRERALAAFAHQETPFERLVEELRPERHLAHAPLFQVTFAFQPGEAGTLRLGAAALEPLGRASTAAKFDLAMTVSEATEGLAVSIEYATDLFDAGTIARVLGWYETLLAEAAAAPDVPLSAIPLLSSEEARRLREANANQGWPSFPSLHAAVEARAITTPGAVALSFEGRRLTYAELNAAANRFARRLREAGVGPEVLVPLLADRSLETIVAILAVWKAGGAYVPLDPEAPRARIARALAETAAPVVLAHEALAPRLGESHPLVLFLDDALLPAGAACDDDAGLVPAPGGTAYVIYTSGSTGAPKGVVVTHGGLASFTEALRRACGLVAEDRVLQFASLTFDASVLEMALAFGVGARLCLARRETLLSGPALAALAASERITAALLPPSLLGVLAPETLPGLRTLLSGGEALPADVAARWAPGRRLLNAYGPTEITVAATVAEIPPGIEGKPPIGRPLLNTRVHLLDARMRPVPVGARGEIYVAGAGVARGYLGRGDLTSERFVPDPFGGNGERLYRTGDLGKWREDGTLEFLGRADAQVKVRGYRIEPGEIEAALVEHDGVKEAAVGVVEIGADARLVAWVVFGDAEVSESALRAHLSERLPEYMVPSVFVALDALPLTPSGKVDRKALPEPERGDRGRTLYVAPRNEAEEKVAGIWARVLRMEKVGAEDDFFALGGHSLLATQVVSRMRDAFGVEVPVRALFEARTVAALAAAATRISEEKRSVASGPIPRAERSGRLPLSFAQQRLWFLDQLEPGPSYNIPTALHLKGALHVPALHDALSEIVRRHEALRTSFPSGDGEPEQKIHPAQQVDLPLLDLSQEPGETKGEKAHRLMAEEAKKPFDLATGPLLRASLVKLEKDEHLLLLTMHHIVSDGWSMGVLVKELTALYGAFAKGEPSPLPELPIQYADFALWQRERLTESALEEQLSYWKHELKDLPLLELPTDRPRPAIATTRGAKETLLLERDLVGKLQELSAREGASLFMTLLAAYETLLYRTTGQTRMGIGTPIANRTRAELEGLIGFFVNTLVLKADLTGEPTFKELLARVKETALSAYARQDVPFEKLVEELSPERDQSRTPLFQAMFVLQNAPEEELKLEGLTLAPAGTPGESAKFELTLSMQESQGELLGILEYNTDLFDQKTARRLLDRFHTLLRSIAQSTDQSVALLRVLPGEEAEAIAALEEGKPRTSPLEGTVVDLFERQAALRAEAPAALFDGAVLTYGDLDARANRVAAHLRRRGVGRGARVALAVDRSFPMLCGLLGILKAGAVYVPLDPSYPEARLAFMLADARVAVLLADARSASSLPSGGHETLLIESLLADPARGEAAGPRSALGAGDGAYVLYTSGSTGRPKGVAMGHGALRNLVEWQLRDSEVGAGERTLQFASLSFDVSAQEIFATFAAGGTLVLVRDEERRDPAALLRRLDAERVARLFLPFVALQQIAEAAEGGGLRPASLREVITAGERLQVTRAIGALFRALPECRLVNHYGPTESHVVTAHRLPESPAAWSLLPPIGRPVDGTRVRVLDARGNRVGLGVPGEIALGGVCLAEGYLNRGDLTGERFVPDPFDGNGERLYRTGDLGKWREDGTLEFLGRGDAQVKVRGYRIEPGEIEAALVEHEGVKEAAAGVVGGGADARLVAWVVFGDEDVGESDLRAHLSERLPEYMVPTVFVALDALPLTPSGKVDRKALPEPERGDRGRALYVAPRNEAEEKVAQIWARVLRLEKVGAEDDFFALGGHSLLATQVVSRMRDAFGVEVPVRALFEARTVAALASAATRISEEKRSVASSPIPRAPREGRLPLSFAQQRLWFLDQLEPGPSYNIPTALHLKGALHVPALHDALSEIVRRHEALRTSFPSGDGEPEQKIHPAQQVDLPLLDLSQEPGETKGEKAHRLMAEEARKPFDLATGPLLRASLVKLEKDEHLLLLTMHHIVSDGWSMGVLVKELTALYGAFAKGEPSPLPELPIQYADFALWQRERLTESTLEEQLSYWKHELKDLPLLELPTDRPRPAIATTRGAKETLLLEKDLVGELQELSAREGASLFMTLLAAYETLLYRTTGQTRMGIGTPIANRTRAELEGLIGFFVNTLVLKADLTGEPTFRELLARVKETALSAYARQDVPFEKLVEELSPERDQSRTPLFQAMFVLQNAPEEELKLEGLTLAPAGTQGESAKFELTLSMQESGGELLGILEYNTDLFDRRTARRLLDRFHTLLRSIAQSPDQSVALLRVLPEEEAAFLRAGNATETPFPSESCFHEVAEAHAARTPDAVALSLGGRNLSWGDLNARANRLARHLRKQGVGPEVLVGILADRSFEMLVGILGVWKAGGAYLPLAPEYPAARLSRMLADSGVALVLAQTDFPNGWEGPLPRIVRLDDAAFSDESAANLTRRETGAGPENLAYVIYTSGSTGTPKGVMVTHRGLCNLAEAQGKAFGVTRESRILQFASFSFDVSVSEISMAMRAGATLVLGSREELQPGPELLELLARERVTTLAIPPSVLAVLPHAPLPDLTTIVAGGEACPAEVVARWAPGRRFLNAYGPTEITVCATAEECRPGTGRPSIGRVFQNTTAHVLGSRMEPAGVGVPGELFLGGAGVSRGYLGRPDLTAERFVPDPFGAPGARLYRTGDRARLLADGRLDFRGRLDEQVKVRGFRIELGEVEAALRTHPGVAEAVAGVQGEGGLGARLVAWVVPQGPAPSLAELREHLGRSLPEHMLPSAVVPLAALPLSANGKVDRALLPAPGAETLRGEACVAPRNREELALCEIWEELLGVRPVGVRDDFFALGGHSLLAVRLVSRVEERLGVRLPVSALFSARTVEALAARLRERNENANAPASPLVTLRPRGEKPPLFLVHPGGGSVFCYAPLARHLAEGRPVHAFQARGLEPGEAPRARVEEMAEAYVAALREAQSRGPYHLAGWSMGGTVAFEIARRLEEDGETIAHLVLLDTHLPAFLPRAEGDAAVLRAFARDLGLDPRVAEREGDAEARLTGILDEARERGLLPRDLSTESLSRLFAVFRANVEAARDWAPRPIRGPITLLAAEESWPGLPAASLEGWRALTTGGFERRAVPGDHYGVVRAPHVAAVAGALDEALEREARS